MRVTPKMIDRPQAARNSEEALAKPVANSLKRKVTGSGLARKGKGEDALGCNQSCGRSALTSLSGGKYFAPSR